MTIKLSEVFVNLVKKHYFYLLTLLTILLISFPTILAIYSRGDFIDLANETVAYRYFFIERVNQGESIAIGVGHLLAIINWIAYSLTDNLADSSVNIRRTINDFSNLTNLIILALQIIFLITIPCSSILNRLQKNILLILPIFLLYGFGFAGFDYMLMPDYHHLNILIVTFAVFIFYASYNINIHYKKNVTDKALLFYGVLLGVLFSNKISLLPILLLSISPFFLATLRNKPSIKLKSLSLISVGMIIGAFIVFSIIYKFNYPILLKGVTGWFKFILNPGVQPDFWSGAFINQIFNYNYIYYFIIYLIIIFLIFKEAFKLSNKYIHILLVLTSFFYIYSLFKRPAGSTFFELSQWFFCLSLMAAGVLNGDKIKRIIYCTFFFVSLVCITTFPFRSAAECVAESSKRSNTKEEFFLKSKELSKNGELIVNFRDNSFHHEGFHEFFLKGASDFPSWQIHNSGKAILNKYIGEIQYKYGDESMGQQILNKNDVLIIFQTPEEANVNYSDNLIRKNFKYTNNFNREDWKLFGKCSGYIVGSLYYYP
jgi:hypothetical protein